MSETATKDYVQISVVEGPRIRGYDDYIVEWSYLSRVLEEYFDDQDGATLKFEVVQLTEEEFEEICENS